MDTEKKRKKSIVSSTTCLDCKKLKKELEEIKSKYLRVLADYQNFEKRVNEEKRKIFDNAKKEFILKLLPFLDNLEKAEIFNKDKGLTMIKDNFLQILKNEGLEEINILGKEFDPHLAEAVEVVKGEKDNQVVEVVRKGYKLNNEVFRVALVKVSKQKVEEEETKKAKEELLKGDYM
ncbi:MAG: nucleotide exchange factor GrpE [Microgenomates group bacterium]|jgi:molecular chaperone GrpE|nr:nucleotide exchange factor GrpE [Microgenomates group bacterium]